MSRPRREDESFEDYRKSIAAEAKPVGVFIAGEGFNREQHRRMLDQAKKELAKARARRYSDEQILDALRSGDKAQQAYAQYIEYFIMKVG